MLCLLNSKTGMIKTREALEASSYFFDIPHLKYFWLYYIFLN